MDIINIEDTIEYKYLECIKSTQDLGCTETGLILPSNINRAYFHEKMCMELFGFDPNVQKGKYLAFKQITDNLDKVCGIYSDCDEWKLETIRDLRMMARYLMNYLNKSEVKLFIEGKTDSLSIFK